MSPIDSCLVNCSSNSNDEFVPKAPKYFSIAPNNARDVGANMPTPGAALILIDSAVKEQL